nr:hypothetical protein Itr_chr07CG08980 [Ipomoea trifida]
MEKLITDQQSTKLSPWNSMAAVGAVHHGGDRAEHQSSLLLSSPSKGGNVDPPLVDERSPAISVVTARVARHSSSSRGGRRQRSIGSSVSEVVFLRHSGAAVVDGDMRASQTLPSSQFLVVNNGGMQQERTSCMDTPSLFLSFSG